MRPPVDRRCRECGDRIVVMVKQARVCSVVCRKARVCRLKQARRQRSPEPNRLRENTATRREQARKASHKAKLKRFGLTVEQYDAMVAAQEGRCAICHQMVVGRLHVDHCHANGHVRGLLCRRCNCGLGLFRDTPEFLQQAITYLMGV